MPKAGSMREDSLEEEQGEGYFASVSDLMVGFSSCSC